jgi:hypothetical protein
MGGPSGRHRAAAAAAAGTLMLSLSRDDVVSPCVRSRTATGRRLGALNGVARIFSAAAKEHVWITGAKISLTNFSL